MSIPDFIVRNANNACFHRTLVSGEIEFCRNVTAERIGWLLRLESQPFTLNASQLATYKNGYLAEYRDERILYQPPRLRNAISEYDQWVSGRAQKFVFGKPPVSPGTFAPQDADGPAQHVGQVLGMLPCLGLTNVTASDLAKLLPPDRFDPALEIMAEVRAYFEGNLFVIPSFFFPVVLICLLFVVVYFSCTQTFCGQPASCGGSRLR